MSWSIDHEHGKGNRDATESGNSDERRPGATLLESVPHVDRFLALNDAGRLLPTDQSGRIVTFEAAVANDIAEGNCKDPTEQAAAQWVIERIKAKIPPKKVLQEIQDTRDSLQGKP